MRLAQRKAQLESTREQEDDVEGDEETQAREVKEGHERFARMFEGIEDDSSDDDDDDDGGGTGNLSLEGNAEDVRAAGDAGSETSGKCSRRGEGTVVV